MGRLVGLPFDAVSSSEMLPCFKLPSVHDSWLDGLKVVFQRTIGQSHTQPVGKTAEPGSSCNDHYMEAVVVTYVIF